MMGATIQSKKKKIDLGQDEFKGMEGLGRWPSRKRRVCASLEI